MLKKKLCFILLLQLLGGNFLWCLNLKVIVKEKNKPISDATVVIIEKKLQLKTDLEGVAIFENLEPGNYTLVVVNAGYEKLSKEIFLEGKDIELNVNLNRVSFSIGEITIQEKRERGKVPASKKIGQDEIKSVSQLVINDAMKVVQSMPGVGSSGSMFDSRMYIQGGDWYEFVAFIDGLVLMNPYKWAGRVSMFNPNWVDSIELFTAGYPTYLGQGLSGALVVKVKEGNRERLKGFFDLSSATTEIGLEGPLGSNTTFYFNIRRTYYELFVPLFFKVEEGVQFPHLTDGVLKLCFTPTIDDKVTVFLYGGEEGMKWKLTGNQEAGEPNYKADFYYFRPQVILGTRYDRRLTEKDSMDVVLAATWENSYGRFDAGPVGTAEWDSKMLTFQTLLNFYINSFDGHKIQTGGAVFLQHLYEYKEKDDLYYLDVSGEWTNSFSYEEKLSNYTLPYYGVYVMDNWEFIKSFILEVGTRFEYYYPNKELNFNPAGGIKW